LTLIIPRVNLCLNFSQQTPRRNLGSMLFIMKKTFFLCLATMLIFANQILSQISETETPSLHEIFSSPQMREVRQNLLNETLYKSDSVPQLTVMYRAARFRPGTSAIVYGPWHPTQTIVDGWVEKEKRENPGTTAWVDSEVFLYFYTPEETHGLTILESEMQGLVDSTRREVFNPDLFWVSDDGKTTVAFRECDCIRYQYRIFFEKKEYGYEFAGLTKYDSRTGNYTPVGDKITQISIDLGRELLKMVQPAWMK